MAGTSLPGAAYGSCWNNPNPPRSNGRHWLSPERAGGRHGRGGGEGRAHKWSLTHFSPYNRRMYACMIILIYPRLPVEKPQLITEHSTGTTTRQLWVHLPLQSPGGQGPWFAPILIPSPWPRCCLDHLRSGTENVKYLIIVSYPLVTLAHQICSAAGQWPSRTA